MTDLDTKIAAWKATEKERTPGEWSVNPDRFLRDFVMSSPGSEVCQVHNFTRDATHICNAVNLVPELVAEVERLRALLIAPNPLIETYVDGVEAENETLRAQVAELEEYKAMYKGLCK